MARVLKKPAVTSDVMLQTGTIIKYAKDTVKISLLLFSAHISYGKGKYLNQTFFFTKFAKNYCSRNVKKYIHRIQLT